MHQELQQLLQSLAGEQKHDLHSECFPLTPDELFDRIWEAVLVWDDLGQALQAWRAMRLEAVAHEAQVLAADSEEADEDDEHASHGQQSTEHPEPDHYTRPSKRLPRCHLVALAQAEKVLLDRTVQRSL